MNPQRCLPFLALSAAGFLLVPVTDLLANHPRDPTLNLGLRDFRVFNNFADSTANNNGVEHPSFPGYTGATLVIWKASVEWGSMLHGDGAGDPTQPGDLGSGAANFDPSFQGETDRPGGIHDNRHSEISENGGGVIAFTEIGLNPGQGWRTRYYANWIFDDGPGIPPVLTRIDLQSVATHQFGHAIGLSHSTDPAASMYPVMYDNSTFLRSFSHAAAAALQFLYGPVAATKPTIASITLDSRQLTILGTNFSDTGNEVWFTEYSTRYNVPVKLTDVPSTLGSTRIDVAVPVAAGPGDVLVRWDSTLHSGLSNAYPIDTRGPDFVPPGVYCSPAQPNSSGEPATIDWGGSISVANNDLLFVLHDLPAFVNGIVVYSPDQASIPLGNGVLCLGNLTLGFVLRLEPYTTDAEGDAQFDYQLAGSVLALRVKESSQANMDLNRDGDVLDTVLAVYEARAGTTTNLAFGLRANSIRVCGGTVGFKVDEASHGQSELNNDGDALDEVLHLYVSGSGKIVNLGLAVHDFDLSSRVIAFEVDESDQDNADLNGDADSGDDVLHLARVGSPVDRP